MPLVLAVMGMVIIMLLAFLHDSLVEIVALKTEVRMLRERYEPINKSDQKEG